nr:hypothetical protein [Tanacetum cinerariifolium]
MFNCGGWVIVAAVVSGEGGDDGCSGSHRGSDGDGGRSETVTNAVHVESSSNKPSKDISKTLRPDAPIIEDWTSNSEDETEIEESVKKVEHPKQAENLRTNNEKSRDFEEFNGGYVLFRGNPKDAIGPKLLFDIDTLNQSMNYQPVVAGNQPNHNADIKENFNEGKVGKEIVSVQQYVLLPLWSTGLQDPQNIDDDSAFDVKENENALHVSPSGSDKTKKHDDKAKRDDKGKSPVDSPTVVRDLRDEFKEFSVNSTNRVNATSAPVTAARQNPTNSTNSFNTASSSDTVISPNFRIAGKSSFVDPSKYLDDPDMPELKDIVYSDDEEDVGAEADLSNLETNISVSPIPTTRVHKDHPVTQIIGLKDPDYPDKIYKVVKALYGLHQTPRACQDKYVAEILKKFGFTDVNSTSTPIETEKHLLKDPDGEDVDVHIYSDYAGASLDRKSTTRDDVIRQDLHLDDADGVECLPNDEIFVELARMGYEKPPPKLTFYKALFSSKWKFFIHTLVENLAFLNDLISHHTKYTSSALTQKVFANMRRVVHTTSAPPSPTTAPSPSPQDPILTPPQAQPATPSLPTHEQPTETSESSIPLLNTLLKTCATLSQKVAELEQDKHTQALEIIKLKKRRRIDQYVSVAATKDVSAAEPTMFDDKEYDEKEENIDWNVVAEQIQEKHLDNIRKYQSLKRKPISIAQARKKMIIYLKNMAGYKMENFRGMTYDKVKYPIIDWEIHSKGSRSYWKINRVGEITEAYQSFEDMLKGFDREDLVTLWSLVKEKFSSAVPIVDKQKSLWVELKRLFKPDADDVL